jgi:glucose-6-phosphate dehydrogenase assembly protein OpcA
MSEDVWSERDTTPDAIEAALRELLRERHAANPELAPARVLNLVVVLERSLREEVANRLDRVGRYHASRTVLCAASEAKSSLDAVAVISYEEPRDGRIGVMHEKVEIELGTEHLSRLGTIVDPLLVSECPSVLWCPHGHDDAIQSLRELIDVMMLDSDEETEPSAAFAQAEEMLESVYVVDLAWLRTTPWRERLAASFDPPQRLAALERITGIAIRHGPSSVASALLLGGWLASRLGWEVGHLGSRNGAGLSGAARVGGGEREIAIELEAADMSVPGLAGVTVHCEGDFSLSLDRASGGLCAKEDSAGDDQRVWRVLGASRGEGGILGEGVRQALLRDPTYGPALSAARGFCA